MSTDPWYVADADRVGRISENVTEAELAESWVGSSDPYGAIGHRFVHGNFHDRQT